MKTKSELLDRLTELVDMVAEMESGEASFASGDLVTVDGKVGQIESFDQDGNYTVRMYDENMEATDEVVTATMDSMTKYTQNPPSDEEKSEDEEIIEEEEEENEFKEGAFVTFEHTEGKGVARVENEVAGVYSLEVYVKTGDEYEPTGVSVTRKSAELTQLAGAPNIKKQPNKILAKLTEVKAESGEDGNVGIIEGYASTFGNVDLGGDRVMKGAFTQTFVHKKTRKVFFDHFYGVGDVAGVGEFSIDEKGLYMRAEMPLGATDVKNAFEKIKFMLSRGEDMGLSIGYNTVKSKMSPEGIRDLYELAVMETSITPFPMNTESLILSAKSRKIEYQAKRQAWQGKPDAPKGNQLDQDGLKSLVEDLKQIITKSLQQ